MKPMTMKIRRGLSHLRDIEAGKTQSEIAREWNTRRQDVHRCIVEARAYLETNKRASR